MESKITRHENIGVNGAIEYNGTMYFKTKDERYRSKNKLLHIELFGRGVKCLGDKDNFSKDNWTNDKEKIFEYTGKTERKIFNNEFYYKDNRTGYFWHVDQKGKKSKSLHKAVYEFHKGKFPKGLVVHHKDFNKENNDISNLEVLSKSRHAELHAKTNKWIGSKENIQQLTEAQELAKKWHGSEEGKKWHSVNGKKAWEKRKYYKKECIVCGEEYTTPYPTRSKYCGTKCKKYYNSRKNKGI